MRTKLKSLRAMRPRLQDLFFFVRGKIVRPIQGLTSRSERKQAIQASLVESSRSPSCSKGLLAIDLVKTRFCPDGAPERKIPSEQAQSEVCLQLMLVQEVLRNPYEFGIGPR